MDHETRQTLLEKFDCETCRLKNGSILQRLRTEWLPLVASHIPKPRLRMIRSALQSSTRRFLYALVPQLVRTRWFDDPSSASNKIHSTSWMNGLRGIAALTVFNCHYLAYFTRTIFIGFGTTPQDRWIHQLPILEFVTDGTLSVDVFFVVGGYVCSHKALQLITNGDKAALFQSLPASVFRRVFRIFIPVFCSTLLIMALAYLGAYEPTRFLLNDDVKNTLYSNGPASEHHPPQFETLSEYVKWWWSDVFDIMNFWKENHPKPAIDPHLWTIHHEFRASMHLYLVLLGTALCKSWARIAIFIILSYIYVGFYTHWVEVSYFWGAALAQVDVIRVQKEKAGQVQLYDRPHATDDSLVKDKHLGLPIFIPSRYSEVALRPLQDRRYMTALRWLLFFIALILCSFPKAAMIMPMPFWETMVKPYIPSFYSPGRAPHFPKQVGVTLLVCLLGTVPTKERAKSLWHRFLTFGPAQYLGSIMFGMYLLHGPLLHLGGFVIPQLVWKRWSSANHGEWGEKEDMGLGIYLTGLFVGWCISLTALLWAADVWTREVDGRCVKVTKWLESIVFVQD